MRITRAAPIAVLFVALLAACGGGSATGPFGLPNGGSNAVPTPVPVPTQTPAQRKISHVVVIIQENRSFDYLFHGYPGADTASSGRTSTGEVVPLTQVPLDAPYDLQHQYAIARTSIDAGRMDGFDRNVLDYPSGKPPSYTPPPNPQYAYAPQSQVQPYIDLASSYVLADRFFPSAADGSFQTHQYLVAGQAGRTYATPLNAPWGCDSKNNVIYLLDAFGQPMNSGIAPCFSYATIADELDRKGLSWRYYAPASTSFAYIWSTFDANAQIRGGADWAADVVSPQTQILTDLANGKLAAVTWVVPDSADSDHPGVYSRTGPAWVTSVVNALGTSRFWSSTAVFVLWDDWGGFYDHVPPPQLDYDGLGIRVPLIAVSPYAHAGRVAHTQYEFGSVLRFVEETFGLASLTAVDARAQPFGSDVFDFEQSPRPFTSLRSAFSRGQLLREHPSRRPPDSDF